ncbi:MAG: RNA pseudouridine synthase [Planctomycetota bacterium]
MWFALPPQVDAGPGLSESLRPLVEAHCVECHAGPKSKGELDLALLIDVPQFELVALAHDFRTFAVQKTYLAWAEGNALPDSIHARQPIGTRPHGPLELACVEPDGQPSLTRLRVLRREPARMLIAAQPITGRANQIRIHAAACGAPLVGDPLYGPGGVPKSNATAAAGGYFLHAAALSFRHPDGRWIKLRSWPDWLE